MGIENPYFLNLTLYIKDALTQIIKFKCVACGRQLGEDQYYVAYEELRKVANQIAKQRLQEHIAEFEIDYLNEIQRGKKT